MGSGGVLGEVTLRSLLNVAFLNNMVPVRTGVRMVVLTDLFVHPAARRKGWACKLIKSAVAYADTNGLDLALEACPYGTIDGACEHSLVKLYKVFGFKKVKEYYMVRRYEA